jgi:hypothetical protein
MIRATCINPGESAENTASITSAFSAKPLPLAIDILTTLSGVRLDAGLCSEGMRKIEMAPETDVATMSSPLGETYAFRASASKAAENATVPTPPFFGIVHPWTNLSPWATVTNCFEVVHAILEMGVVCPENDANIIGFEDADSEDRLMERSLAEWCAARRPTGRLDSSITLGSSEMHVYGIRSSDLHVWRIELEAMSQRRIDASSLEVHIRSSLVSMTTSRMAVLDAEFESVKMGEPCVGEKKVTAPEERPSVTTWVFDVLLVELADSRFFFFFFWA